MKPKINYCIKCGNRVKTNGQYDACIHLSGSNHTHFIQDPNAEYCHAFSDESSLARCQMCNSYVEKDHTVIIVEDGKLPLILCSSCYNTLNTCKSCKRHHRCDFITNPIDIPPQVTKTVKQGNAIIQAVITNPDRVAETCMKNCECWDFEVGQCRKDIGWCMNYLFR